MRFRSLALALTLFAAPTLAQNCSTLSITADEETISLDLTGSSAEASTFLAVGDTLGATDFAFGPLGGFTLDLAAPFAILPMGATDADGNISTSFDLPTTLGFDLNAQAVSADLVLNIPPTPGELPITLEFCTSNVEALSL